MTIINHTLSSIDDIHFAGSRPSLRLHYGLQVSHGYAQNKDAGDTDTEEQVEDRIVQAVEDHLSPTDLGRLQDHLGMYGATRDEDLTWSPKLQRRYYIQQSILITWADQGRLDRAGFLGVGSCVVAFSGMGNDLAQVINEGIPLDPAVVREYFTKALAETTHPYPSEAVDALTAYYFSDIVGRSDDSK